MTPREPMIAIAGLNKWFGPHHVLRDIDLVVGRGAKVVGLSGLLTISFDSMKDTISALKAAGMPVKVMVGGGPLTEQVREYVGADALGADAQAAVRLAEQWSAEMEVA